MIRVYGLIPINASAPVTYYRRQGSTFEAMQAEKAGKADEVIILVPGTDAGVFNIRLPVRNETEARRAAPFAVEDELAVPVDDVHVALGKKVAGNPFRRAVVVNHDAMQAWMERLGGLMSHDGLQLVADTSVLPAGPAYVNLGDRLIFANSEDVFAVESALEKDAIQAIISEAGFASAEMPPAGDVQKLLTYADEGELIDLRQGGYAAQRERDISWAEWRTPALLAAGAAAAWLSASLLETRALNKLSKQMEARAENIYTSANPGEPIPRNLVLASRDSSGARASLDFRTASAALYAGAEAVEGTGIRSIRFDKDRGTLRANMSFQNYGDELKLKTLVEEAGIAVRVGDTRREAGAVIGDLTLEMPR